MQTLTDLVAAVVVHSSAVAYAHFGVPIDAQQLKPAAEAERVVARSVPQSAAAGPRSSLGSVDRPQVLTQNGERRRG